MIRIIFGLPRCGKTTWCVKQLIKKRKKYRSVWANFPHAVPGAGWYDGSAGLGAWMPPKESYGLLDESGIEFNSRSYKSLSKACIAYLKKHGHAKQDLDFLSQSHDDIDVTVRRLAQEYWILYRLGPWTLGRRIYRCVGVDKNTEQIIDKYHMASWLWLLIWPLQLGWPFEQKFNLTFRPFYYRYFDSYAMDDIPVRPPIMVSKK